MAERPAIGRHEGGYLPFDLDVTNAVRPGANTLTVRVSDTLAEFREVPHGKQSWYGPLSGLWQSVWVEHRPALHLGRLHVTAQVAEAQAEQCYRNIRTVVEHFGGTIDDVVKITQYITDLAYRPLVARPRDRCFGTPGPASTLVVIKGLAMPECLVEIEAVAVLE